MTIITSNARLSHLPLLLPITAPAPMRRRRLSSQLGNCTRLIMGPLICMTRAKVLLLQPLACHKSFNEWQLSWTRSETLSRPNNNEQQIMDTIFFRCCKQSNAKTPSDQSVHQMSSPVRPACAFTTAINLKVLSNLYRVFRV